MSFGNFWQKVNHATCIDSCFSVLYSIISHYKSQEQFYTMICNRDPLYFFVFQEGKKIKSFSGFKGRGFKFDETEAHLAEERKILQKKALGLQDSDDEDGGLDVSNIDLIHIHTNLLCFCYFLIKI